MKLQIHCKKIKFVFSDTCLQKNKNIIIRTIQKYLLKIWHYYSLLTPSECKYLKNINNRSQVKLWVYHRDLNLHWTKGNTNLLEIIIIKTDD